MFFVVSALEKKKTPTPQDVINWSSPEQGFGVNAPEEKKLFLREMLNGLSQMIAMGRLHSSFQKQGLLPSHVQQVLVVVFFSNLDPNFCSNYIFHSNFFSFNLKE